MLKLVLPYIVNADNLYNTIGTDTMTYHIHLSRKNNISFVLWNSKQRNSLRNNIEEDKMIESSVNGLQRKITIKHKFKQ